MSALAQLRLLFGFCSTSGLWPINLRANFTAPLKIGLLCLYTDVLQEGKQTHLPLKKNWLDSSKKATSRTDQTNVPDTTPQRHHLCMQTKLPHCCSAWKAVGAEPLSTKRDSVCECAFCLSPCYFFVPFIPAETPHLSPERTREARLTTSSGGRPSSTSLRTAF